MDKSCFDCQFYKTGMPVVSVNPRQLLWFEGQCRRHAPVASLKKREQWPVVHSNDYCGDHKLISGVEIDARMEHQKMWERHYATDGQ